MFDTDILPVAVGNYSTHATILAEHAKYLVISETRDTYKILYGDRIDDLRTTTLLQVSQVIE